MSGVDAWGKCCQALPQRSSGCCLPNVLFNKQSILPPLYTVGMHVLARPSSRPHGRCLTL